MQGSELVSGAPATFSSALRSLHNAYLAAEDDIPNDQRQAEGTRALNALVLESANLVFSTSTSPDVEQLSEDGAQFDWVIIEEAAKASAPDLLGPLSLSGRRLFIGDHNQLPPFDADRISAIVSDNAKIRNAVAQAEEELGATFFETGLDFLRRDLEDDEALSRVTGMAARAMEPFRLLVQEDAERRSTVGGGKRASVERASGAAQDGSCHRRTDIALLLQRASEDERRTYVGGGKAAAFYIRSALSGFTHCVRGYAVRQPKRAGAAGRSRGDHGGTIRPKPRWSCSCSGG